MTVMSALPASLPNTESETSSHMFTETTTVGNKQPVVVTGTHSAADAMNNSHIDAMPGTTVTHATGEPPSLAEGMMVGPFRVVSRLGQGGMGTVWKAEDTVLGRHVAVKVLAVADEEARRRFVREARLAASLSHPNLLTIHHVGEYRGHPYLVTELMMGGSLDGLVHRAGPLPAGKAAELIRQAALGLDCAHKAGIVHRDVKPGNLLLGLDGTLKVGDFGLARFLADSAQLTTPGMVVGTPQYLAPELCEGGAPEPAGDIYALGCTLYFLLAGKRPFEAESVYQLLLKHLHEPLPDIRKARPDVSPGLAGVVERACRKNKSERYASAREMADHLAAVLAAEAVPGCGTETRLSKPTEQFLINPGKNGGKEQQSSVTDINEVPSAAMSLPTPLMIPAPPAVATPNATVPSQHTDPADPELGQPVLPPNFGMFPPMPLDPNALPVGPVLTYRDWATMRNRGVVAGLVLTGLMVWLFGAIFRGWPAGSFWQEGLHDFDWSDLKDGSVLAYFFWLATGAMMAGPMVTAWSRRFGRAGAVTGVLVALDAGLALSMATWGPVPGLLLLTTGLLPVSILMLLQSYYDEGFSVAGMVLMWVVSGTLTAVVVNHQTEQAILAGVLDEVFRGRLIGSLPWWYYVIFTMGPALLVFLPTVCSALFDLPLLRRGRFQIGLALCLLVSMYLWGPVAGAVLPLIPLSIMAGAITVILG